MLLIPRDGCACFELMQCLLTFHRDLTLDSDAVPETGTILNYMSFWISASNKRLHSQSMKFDGFKLGPFGGHLHTTLLYCSMPSACGTM